MTSRDSIANHVIVLKYGLLIYSSSFHFYFPFTFYLILIISLLINYRFDKIVQEVLKSKIMRKMLGPMKPTEV